MLLMKFLHVFLKEGALSVASDVDLSSIDIMAT
jgi:hypothetical protein